MLMTAPGNSRSIFLITGPDNGEKFLVGSSKIRTFAPLKLILKRNTFAFCPPDNSRIGHLVTEMKPIKHYFDMGVMARQGIEY